MQEGNVLQEISDNHREKTCFYTVRGIRFFATNPDRIQDAQNAPWRDLDLPRSDQGGSHSLSLAYVLT